MFWRKLRVQWAMVVVFGLAATGAAQDWAGKGRAHGIVKDPQGQALQGVKITLHPAGDPEDGPEPVYTNQKGRWAVAGLLGGHWTVLLDLEDYKPSQGTIQVNEFGISEAIEVTLELDPYSSIRVADALLESGQYAEARAEYLTALPNLEPSAAARLRSHIGDTYFEEGNYAAARQEYEQALPQIEPAEQAHIRLQMANSYEREERYSEAREEFERVLPLLSPEGQARVLLIVARTHDLDNDRDQAIATLERALELEPGDPQLLLLIADLLTRAGREAEAQEYLAQLPEDTELPADLILNIGIRFYNEGDTDKAYAHFNRAVEENPELAETYYYRGLVLVGRGENDQARADFHKLLELEPDSSHAQEVNEFLKYLEPGG